MASSPLHHFKRKLTNLSSANPLLWMTRLKAGLHLDLNEWEMAEGKPLWELINSLLGGKKKIPLCAVFDPADRFSNQFSQKIGRIVKQKKLLFQERGVDELYVAYPFIEGLWPDGSPLRMPFLFIPVRLESIVNQWNIFPEINAAFINPAFLLAYAHHTGAALPESVFEKDLDLEAEDARSYLTAFYHKIKESGLQIHFNQDLFSGRILPFQNLNKDSQWTGFQPGMMKLAPHAVLGLFSQSESMLIPDFRFLEENQVLLEDIFLKAAADPLEIREENLLCPLPSDGSQEACIRRVKSGQSIVIQGPPGTGKSQVITNLMADAMGSGKTVLLVCQKRVALEVVQKRLQDLGLGAYAAMWSDFKKDRDPLYARLARTIENLEDAEAGNQHLDTVILERNYLKICRNIEEITRKLEGWKSALFQKETAGISVRELYEAVKHLGQTEFGPEVLQAYRWEEWQVFKSLFLRYRFDFQSCLQADSVLSKRKNWADFAAGALPFFKNLVSEWNQVCPEISDLFLDSEAFRGDFDKFPFAGIVHLHAERKDFYSGRQPGFMGGFEPFAAKKVSLPDVKERVLIWLKESESLLDWPAGLVLEKSEIQVLGDIFRNNHRLLNLKLPLWLKGRIKPGTRPFLEKLKETGEAKVSPARLVAWLDAAKAWFEAAEALEKYGAFGMDNPEGKSAFSSLSGDTIRNTKVLLNDFLREYPFWQKIQNQAFEWKKYLKPGTFDSLPRFLKTMDQLQAAFLSAESLKEKWNAAFQGPAGDAFLTAMRQPEEFLRELGQKIEAIAQTDRLFLEQGPDFENLVRAIIRENPGEKTAEAWTAFLDAVWTRFWINKIENSFPVLREVHSPAWAEEIHFLQNQIQEKARLTAGILQLRLSENSYKNLEYNRLNNRVSYRELFHQVSKKRMKKPLRALWQSHSEEIKKLIPAWLATPESVSATWDMHTRFDLVIFDESSQCFAEKGLPAAYRGDTLVVVGDSKQLQPNQHFMSRWEDGDEEDAVSGQVSLLDLACQFLPQNTLRGHYRSEYPELIAFSNLHFYQNKLEFLPHARALKNRMPAIRWMQTHGIWKDQQNEAEALAIAESIFDFASSRPGESIGIITFNIRQQMLIEQYAEALSLEKQQPLPPSLFIKNIENVQGDECDHLWFSIAYAPNEAGKIHYQFGSLSQAGGENRLNVAITRARKSICIFCSLQPGQFDPGPQAPAGPALLKQFLNYAREIHQSGMQGLQNFSLPEKNWWQEVQEALKNDTGSTEPELQPGDGALLYKSSSAKDYFGYKPLIFKEKGYKVKFRYARPQVPAKASPPKTAS